MKKNVVSIDDLPKEDINIYYGLHETEFGNILVVSTKDAFISLEFVSSKKEEEKLLTNFPKATLSHKITDHLLQQFYRKEPVKVYVRAGKFQKSVWQELTKIPEGTLLSYQEIAKNIGNPKSMRAVGNAVGSNPVSLIIPCHRVVRKNGQIGGYRWGIEKKMQIIAKESKK